MTLNQYKLTSLLLEDHFGPVIASVSEELKWGPRTLKLLSVNSKLPMSTVSLTYDIRYRLQLVIYQ